MSTGGSWWPSLGWASLPYGVQLPSLEAFTTRHWQRRLLRYLIKRTLTGLLRIPEDDVEKNTYLDADLASGSVSLRNVELDEESVNRIIRTQLGVDKHHSQVDIILLAGHLANVDILVGSSDSRTDDDRQSEPSVPAKPISATERLLTAPIRVIAKSLVLDFRINPAVTAVSEDGGSYSEAEDVDDSIPIDLGASILHVAQDYVHAGQPGTDSPWSEEDDAEEAALPGGFDNASHESGRKTGAASEQEQVGLIARVVEALLERLHVCVKDVTIRLALGDDISFELKLSRLEVKTEYKGTKAASSTTRSMQVEGLSISVVQQGTSVAPEISPCASSSTSSTGSSDDMAMTMAIADLRTSENDTGNSNLPPLFEPQASLLAQSVYMDAEDAAASSEAFENDSQFHNSSDKLNRLAKPPHSSDLTGSARQIFGIFEHDPLRLACIEVRHVIKAYSSTPSTGPDRVGHAPIAKPSSNVQVTSPILAASIDPATVIAVLDFMSRLPSIPSKSQQNPSADRPQGGTLFHIRVKRIHLFGQLGGPVHTLQDLVRPPTPPPAASTTDSHLISLFFDTLECAYRVGTSDAKVAVNDFGLYLGQEGVSSKVDPLILADPGLAWQHEGQALHVGDTADSSGDWSLLQRASLREWRTRVPSLSSSLSASTRLPLLQHAIAARLSGTDLRINVQPVHIWLDAKTMDVLLLKVNQSGILQALPNNQGGCDPPSTFSGDPLVTTLSIPTLRMDVRCPTTFPGMQTFGLLRSGLVSLSLHDVCVAAGNPSESSQTRPSLPAVSASSAIMMVAAHPDRPYVCILGANSASLEETISVAPVWRELGGGVSAGLSFKIRVPKMDIYLTKATMDVLQYLVDDLTRFFTRLGEYVTNEVHPPARQPTSISSEPLSAGYSVVEAEFRLDQGNICLVLSEPSNSWHVKRELSVTTYSALVTAELSKDNRAGLVLSTSLGEVMIEEKVTTPDHASRRDMLAQRPPCHIPSVYMRLVSTVDCQNAKHSSFMIRLQSLQPVIYADTSWTQELAAFLKAPPGAFLDVVPTQSTKIQLEIRQFVVKVLPLALSSALAVSVDKASFKALLVCNTDSTKYRMKVGDVQVWLADPPLDFSAAHPHLKTLGYALLIHFKGLSVIFKAHHTSGDSKISVQSLHTAHVFACPDTLQCLIDLVGDLQKSSDRTQLSADQQEPSSTEQALPDGNVVPLSNSLSLPSDAMLHAEYPERRDRAAEPVSNVEGEVIQIVSPSAIEIVGNWLQARRHRLEKNEPSLPCFKLNVEIRDVTLSLYQGYDFEKTRKHVKNAVKATRKRLEKIKQLLADGQVPEQTMEEVADPLLQSVFLPQRIVRVRTESHSSNASLAEEVDVVDRIVAFDDELDREDNAEADTFLTWEKVSDRPPGPSRTPSNLARPATSKIQRPSLLTRPRNSAIDVHLSGIEVCTRSLPQPANVASTITITIKELSVVDNIRTSTWNKFLTELRPRDGGITRPTGSPMVRVILKMLRPSPFAQTVEADLSVRIAPLRLHIDQDALDFLKAFFAFKTEIAGDAPGTAAQRKEYSPEQAIETHEGFVQRVEIHAVKIKLDYKPKRVDYYALRQGRAIEMMNFFHFEGSEMVLRHLVLTGVPSWEKVGDMLQEIWTPDVKANQLADFLAGINPIRSVVNVGHGVAELVLLPVAQYRKDGKLARGVQRGSAKFVKSTAMEAIKLGARLATGTQVILEHAEHVLGGRIEASVTAQGHPGASSTPPHDMSQPQWILTTNDEGDDEGSQYVESERTNHSRYAQQPEDVKEGLQTAYKSLSGNVRSAAETILAVPMEVYERSNDGAVRAVVRAVPIAVLKPMIGATEAVSKTLLGLRNTLEPGVRAELQDKYKGRRRS